MSSQRTVECALHAINHSSFNKKSLKIPIIKRKIRRTATPQHIYIYHPLLIHNIAQSVVSARWSHIPIIILCRLNCIESYYFPLFSRIELRSTDTKDASRLQYTKARTNALTRAVFMSGCLPALAFYYIHVYMDHVNVYQSVYVRVYKIGVASIITDCASCKKTKWFREAKVTHVKHKSQRQQRARIYSVGA